MKKPLFLCIETATKLCSVALTQGSELIHEVEASSDQYIHAESLHPFIAKVLEGTDHQMKDIDALVVSKGPGSYTGLRIGVSAVKGLAYALNKPVIAVNSLKGIAAAAFRQNTDVDFVAPVIDARRDEVYTMLMNPGGDIVEPTHAQVITDDFYTAYNGKSILVVGDASSKVEKLCSDNKGLIFDHALEHKALHLSILAESRYTEQKFEDVAYFEPYYLKEFIAGKPRRQFKKL
tara:strand:+ start:119 stop:820 length:702 start_codon:yes stop_codon:yes gene_type:complete